MDKVSGKTVLILRPRDQKDQMEDELRSLGARTICVPAIEIVAPSDPSGLDRALVRLSGFEKVVFTSVNGVDATFQRLTELGVEPPRVDQVVAIGPVTATRLSGYGVDAGWVPTRFTTQALADQMPSPDGPVLLIRAEVATDELDQLLRSRGMDVTRVDAYSTVPINREQIRATVVSGVDAVAVTSASIARSLAEATSGLEPPRLFSIGPATTTALSAAGLQVAGEADPHTSSGLVRCIAAYLRD